MNIKHPCDICNRGLAKGVCRICGLKVCEFCYDKVSEVCIDCKKGRMI